MTKKMFARKLTQWHSPRCSKATELQLTQEADSIEESLLTRDEPQRAT